MSRQLLHWRGRVGTKGFKALNSLPPVPSRGAVASSWNDWFSRNWNTWLDTATTSSTSVHTLKKRRCRPSHEAAYTRLYGISLHVIIHMARLFWPYCGNLLFYSRGSGMCKTLKVEGPASSHIRLTNGCGWGPWCLPLGPGGGLGGRAPGSFWVLVILKAKGSQFQWVISHSIWKILCTFPLPSYAFPVMLWFNIWVPSGTLQSQEILQKQI